MAARLRKGDEVVVISGKNKGKKGEVLRVLVDDDKVLVKGVNMIKRHTKPSARNQEGSIVEREAPIRSCKVMPVDPKTGLGTRVRFKLDENNKKVRVAVKSGEIIVSAPAAASTG